MDNLIYITFICIAMPLGLLMFLLPKKSRIIVAFVILGAFLAVSISGINGYFLQLTGNDMFFTTTNITPIAEELIKFLPILFFDWCYEPKAEILIPVSMATGIGFAILENAVILINCVDSVSIGWAVIRVLGSGLMHGICTSLIGIGMTFTKKKRKMVIPGTFSLFIMATIYHGIYNILVQSDYKIIGFILPTVTFIPLYASFVVILKRQKGNNCEAKKNQLGNLIER